MKTIAQQLNIKRCPFCGGSKTKPFVRLGRSQDCKECDKNGMVSKHRLEELGVEHINR